MPLHVLSRFVTLLDKDIKKSKVLVCGVSYRQDVGDTRYSPTELLVTKLLELGADVICHDPHVTYWEEMSMQLTSKLPKANNFDAVIFAVSHKYYKDIDIASWADGCNLLFDANSLLSDSQRKLLRENNIRVESVGRGDGL